MFPIILVPRLTRLFHDFRAFCSQSVVFRLARLRHDFRFTHDRSVSPRALLFVSIASLLFQDSMNSREVEKIVLQPQVICTRDAVAFRFPFLSEPGHTSNFFSP
jgi:hypothetical protein